ncbi:hypothetical protein LCGC14_0166980 [marine sediment metagenome]|uniref:GIY-YIG domain-containing protein n=1 Tax=marine sediment metagenome TaxID=412755 RepID=A0A0F9XBF9_9ZZZZ|nr:GIY-YIG nuclease family protein [Halomonas sp.]HDZ45839.1 GIY-YIG nuclease family protein [Halomonas sp.]
MLSTFIRDIYAQHETEELAEAIEDIASSVDTNGWASAGVYCFWDPKENEVLYIGLARDLSVRFREHNNLKSCPAHSCKRDKVAEWFQSNERLGYSILVQSQLSQPEVTRNSKGFCPSTGSFLYDALQAIKISEGVFIEAQKLAKGKFSPWNKVGGYYYGKDKATSDHQEFIELFTNRRIDTSVALSSIRELSSDATLETFELYLHVVRQMMTFYGMSFSQAWHLSEEYFEEKKRIQASGYIPNLSELLSQDWHS